MSPIHFLVRRVKKVIYIYLPKYNTSPLLPDFTIMSCLRTNYFYKIAITQHRLVHCHIHSKTITYNYSIPSNKTLYLSPLEEFPVTPSIKCRRAVTVPVEPFRSLLLHNMSISSMKSMHGALGRINKA